MNTLPLPKRTKIIQLLVEGMSIRSITRVMDVSKNTVTKLLVEVGTACMNFHNDRVKNVKSQRVQADEIWAFVNSKEKNTSAEIKEKGNGDAGEDRVADSVPNQAHPPQHQITAEQRTTPAAKDADADDAECFGRFLGADFQIAKPDGGDD